MPPAIKDQTQTPPADNNVIVPKHVRDAATRAEALHKLAYNEQQAEPAAPVVEPPAPEPPLQTEPPPAPEPPLQTEPPPTPELPPAPQQDYAALERNYNAMVGRHNQDMQTIQQLQDQLRELSNDLMGMHHQLQARAAPPAQRNGNGQVQVLTPKDREDYGDDLIGFTQRAAREAIAPELQQLKAENAQLRTSQKLVQHMSIEDALDRYVPTWREVFTNPRFAQWLSLPDVYSGNVRSEMLRHAADSGHAGRVVAFYQGFLAEEAATGHIQSPGREPPAPRPPAVSALTIAAPGRGSPAATQINAADAATNKLIFTRAQVDQFYANIRKGRYAGRDAEKDRDEQMIHQAIVEGRVR